MKSSKKLMGRELINVYINVNLHNTSKFMILLFTFIYFNVFPSFCGFYFSTFERSKVCLNEGSCRNTLMFPLMYSLMLCSVRYYALPNQFDKVKVGKK